MQRYQVTLGTATGERIPSLTVLASNQDRAVQHARHIAEQLRYRPSVVYRVDSLGLTMHDTPRG